MSARAVLALALAISTIGCKNVTSGRPGVGAIGAACAVAEDCSAGASPTCLSMAGGYCSQICGEADGDVCGGESICEGLDAHAYYCLDGCLTRNENADCRDGYRCAERPDVENIDGAPVGVCLPACVTDSHCEAGRRCDVETGSCLAPGERPVGEPCERPSDCSGAQCVLGRGFAGGMCSGRCGPDDSPCPESAVCVALGGTPLCARPCANDSDCRQDEGYRCRDVNGVPVCLPGCREPQDCPTDAHCDIGTGRCLPGAPAGEALGAACSADADCRLGKCAADWPGGACVYPCPCPEDATVACVASADPARCVAPCAGDADCRAGYLCRGGACQPPCTRDAECGAGLVCQPGDGHCTAQAVDVGPPRLEWRELAAGVAVGGMPSAALTLDVPESVLGVALVVDGQGADALVLAELTDPDGRVLFDYGDPLRSPARFFPADQAVAAILPVSPDTAPRPGRYRFRLIKDGPERFVRARALFKTSGIGDAAPATAALDARFVFVGVEGLSAREAPQSAAFQDILTRLRALFDAAGLSLASVSFCEMPAADARRYSTISDTDGPESELSRMFELSSQAQRWGCAAEAALTFFLVDEIQGGRDGYTILGVAGGIPGPPRLAGTGHSGVAVTMAGFARQPQRVAQTMAHEAGHFLGLFHTTEAEATLFDPLSDTAQCERDRDENEDGLLDYGECKGAGAENLMFWAAGSGARALSPHQAFVLRRHPGLL